MKILIVSDTHGRDDNLVKVLKKVKPIDFLIHCGDLEGSEKKIRDRPDAPVRWLKGIMTSLRTFRGKRSSPWGDTKCS